MQAREILDANLASPPTYPELAHAVFLSETKLSQGFRRLYGTSIHAYVIDRRLDLALSLIEEGADNVAQVAAKVGYGNSSHFSAAFKRRFGVLPRGCGGPHPPLRVRPARDENERDPGRNAPDFG